MADTNFIVDPDNGAGTDYTALVTFESTEQTTISSGDRYLVECRSTGGSADTNALGCHIDGWTISGELIIFTTPQYRHRGIYPSSGDKYYRIETNSSWMNPIRLNEPNVTLEGLAVKSTYSTPNHAIGSTSGNTGGTSKLIGNYAHGGRTGRCFSITVEGSGDVHYFINNFAYNGEFGFALGGVSGGTQYIYNNAAVSSSDDLYRTYTVNCTYYNNVSQWRGNQYYDAFGVLTDDTNNVEADNNYINISVNIISGSVSFMNRNTGDLKLEINDNVVKGKAIDLSNDSNYPFNKDFLDQPRGVLWDLGPHQVQRTSYNMII